MKVTRRKTAKSSILVPAGLLPELRELIHSAR